MKELKLENHTELGALVDQIYANANEREPISLTRNGRQVAIIVSATEYKALRELEESALDRLDAEESDKILQDPKWIGWDSLKRQLKA